MSEHAKGLLWGFVIACCVFVIGLGFIVDRHDREIVALQRKYLAIQQLQIFVADHEERLKEIEPTGFQDIQALQDQVGRLMETAK